ncbi:MAG: protein rep [Bacteroidales bacterium]|nr:protein rep [Bacteroidales bacterium]
MKKKEINCPEEEIEFKFLPHKKRSLMLSESLYRLHLENRSLRVKECGTFIEMRKYDKKYIAEGEREWKLSTANFCRDRLCSMCNWRRSLKIFGQVSKIMDNIPDSYRFIFLTLTVKNCKGSELKYTVRHLLSSFKKMANYKPFKQVFKGYFRTLECTHNHIENSYHPHLHVILAVNKSYFKSKNYISHSKFVEMWQKALKISYEPQVNIQKIKDERHMVAEVAKYAVKSDDYIIEDNLEYTDEIVMNFIIGMSNVRLIAYGGIFNEVRKKLDLDDAENGDLVHVNNDTLRSDVSYMVYNFHWSSGIRNYTLKKEMVYNVQIECDEDN